MAAYVLPCGASTLVDDVDLPLLLTFAWRVGTHGYLERGGGGRKTVFLHRLISAPDAGQEVDHINGHKLDNRRSNLRNCTRTENARNVGLSAQRKHGMDLKGISRNLRNSPKWTAYINVGGRQIYLGSFETAIGAAKAYDAAARRLFGAFARTNFPLHVEEA